MNSTELIDVYETLKRHEMELLDLRNEIAGLRGSMREHEREMSFYRDSRDQAERASTQNRANRVRLYAELIAKLRAL
jgi:hypothetical protein